MSFNGCLTPAGGEKKNRGCFFADNVKEVSGIQAHMEMKPLDLTARVRAVGIRQVGLPGGMRLEAGGCVKGAKEINRQVASSELGGWP